MYINDGNALVVLVFGSIDMGKKWGENFLISAKDLRQVIRLEIIYLWLIAKTWRIG